MPLSDLKSDLPPTVVSDERFEVALFTRDGKKYRAVRELDKQTWRQAKVEEITSDHFYMIVACVQRRKKGTRGLVGLG